MDTPPLDAVIVGAGPNGLAAAITLAREGRSVLVLEAADSVGGGTRSAQWTLPGFVHDVCSAIHPLGVASPFFQTLPLEAHGLEWIHPDVPVSHPLEDGTAAAVYRCLEETAVGFGADGSAYRRLLAPLVARGDGILDQVLRPLSWSAHPLLLLRLGLRGAGSARGLAERWFIEPRVQAMFAGMAAHSVMPLDRKLTAAVGLIFCLTAHGRGWPLPRGGSQRIALAMQRYLQALGGEVVAGTRVATLRDIPRSRAILLDVSPRNCAASRGTYCRPRIAAGWRDSVTVRECSKSTGPWTTPSRGRRRRAGGQVRCTWVERSRRWRRRSRQPGADLPRSVPSYWSPNRVCSMRLEPQRGSRPAGPTVTSLTDRRAT